MSLAFSLHVRASDAGPAGTQPWVSQRFNYDRPDKISLEQTTPTANHLGFVHRPDIADPNTADPRDSSPAKPRTVDGMDFIHLRFKDVCGKIVPALLCRPHSRTGVLSVVIAIHGLGSNKAQVCAQVGPSLTRRGFAVLAADLPCHGERPGEPRTILTHVMADGSHTVYAEAVIDVRELIDVAEQLPDLDTHHGVALVGYSLGSWVGSIVGPADSRVRAMVLMVGGALDVPQLALSIPEIASTDPRLAIIHFAGRPLLMLNGREDRTVPPETANRLWLAARQPKEQRWYDSGHLLPKPAYEDAANWIQKHSQTVAAP